MTKLADSLMMQAMEDVILMGAPPLEKVSICRVRSWARIEAFSQFSNG
jgi:hypothetical protein